MWWAEIAWADDCAAEAERLAAAAQQEAWQRASAPAQRAVADQWAALAAKLEPCATNPDPAARWACAATVDALVTSIDALAQVTVPAATRSVTTSCGPTTRVNAELSMPVGQDERRAARSLAQRLRGATSPHVGALRWAGNTAANLADAHGVLMMEHEVTQAQWRAVTGRDATAGSRRSYGTEAGPCAAVRGVSLVGDTYPAVCVSWRDAAAFANTVSDREGRSACYGADGAEVSGCTGYRLPTEAEWQNANDRPPGDCKRGNFVDRSASRLNLQGYACDDGVVALAAVKSYAPTDAGIYDLQGNVREWTGTSMADASRAPGAATTRYPHLVVGESFMNQKAGTAQLPDQDQEIDLGFRLVRAAP
jgi:hypothetical protein